MVPKKNGKQRKIVSVFLFSILIFVVWILLINWGSFFFFDDNCFRLYLRYGAEISIATSFLALIWEGLERQNGLVSWHPAEFLSSCLSLIGLYYLVVSANLTGPIHGFKKRGNDIVSLMEAVWDGFFAIIMNLLMAVLVFGWLLVVAPLFYLLVLVTGAPARRAIRDTGRTVIVKEEAFKTIYEERPSNKKIPDGYKNISFETKPFALTNAMNAIILYLVELFVF